MAKDDGKELWFAGHAHPSPPPITSRVPTLECISIQAVVGGCHSLTRMNGTLRGDPLEASALEGVGWTWDPITHTARPATVPSSNNNTTIATPTSDMVHKGEGRGGEATIGTGKHGGQGGDVSVAVWRRHAFSSQLQRMSVVAEVSGAGLTADEGVPEVKY